MQTSFRSTIEARERKLDQVLADSFPASDSPPWTLGRVTVVVSDDSRTMWQWIASVIGAIGATLLLPIAILVIGLPIAFALRGILEVVAWLRMLVIG